MKLCPTLKRRRRCGRLLARWTWHRFQSLSISKWLPNKTGFWNWTSLLLPHTTWLERRAVQLQPLLLWETQSYKGVHGVPHQTIGHTSRRVLHSNIFENKSFGCCPNSTASRDVPKHERGYSPIRGISISTRLQAPLSNGQKNGPG